MSSGNPFHYFSSKREIFAAIFEDEGNEKAERLAAAETGDDPLACASRGGEPARRAGDRAPL